MVTNLVNQVKNKFLSNFIKVDEDWLSGCVEWVHSENPSFSAQEVYRKAYEQWLLADLTEVAIPCLPERVTQQKEPFSLTGKFPLQMNYIVDISESFYDQWRRLNDQKLDEPEPVEEFRTQTKQPSKKKRLLKLELTDGTRKVDAMEYRPIACLSTKIFPGCKILISGPLQCSNGVLLLTPPNIKILGGEVDTLLVPNAFENMLLKGLNKPLNPKPRMDYQEITVVEDSQPSRTQNRPVIMATFDRETKAISNVAPVNPVAPVRSELDQFIDEDDELLMGIELDAVEAGRGQNGRPTTPELLEFEREDDFFNNSVLDTLDRHASQNPPEQLPVPSTSKQSRESLRDFVDETLFVDDFSPIPEPQHIPSILDRDYKFKIRGLSFVTIDQLKAALEKDKAKFGERSFILRAKFFKVVEKLTIQNEYWNMGILLSDSWSKENLNVRILSVALNKLSGHTAKELSEMYKTVQSRPHVKEKILEILDDLKEKIKKVDCFMKIDYSPELPCPTLVDLIDPAPVLNGILREKIKSENLT